MTDKISSFLLGVVQYSYYVNDENKISRDIDRNFIFNEENIQIFKEEKNKRGDNE